MASIVLKFDEHHNRLGNIAWLARFLDGAVGRGAKTLSTEPGMLKSEEELIAALRTMFEAVSPPREFDVEEVRSRLAKWRTPLEDSRLLVYSLCLVMLVTQVEIFIDHLIDAILSKEPRRLKDLAGEKQLNFRELVDAQDYEAVMARFREKGLKGSSRLLDSRHARKAFRAEILLVRKRIAHMDDVKRIR